LQTKDSCGLPERDKNYPTGPNSIDNHVKVQAAAGNKEALKKVSKYYDAAFRFDNTTYAE
jgi:hypothetical protein